MRLKYSAVSGIIGLAFVLLGTGSKLAIVIWATAAIIFEWGFKTIGEKTQNKLLEFSALGYIILFAILALLTISPFSLAKPMLAYPVVLFFLSHAILGVCFGVALLNLQQILPTNLIKTTAILIIIPSIMTILSMLDIFLGELVIIPQYPLLKALASVGLFVASILMVVILFKADKLEQFK